MSGQRFRFRLAPVLRVARLREDVRRAHVAAAAAAEVAAERHREERTAAYEARPALDAAPAADFDDQRLVADLRARSVADAETGKQVAEDRLSAARDEWLRAARRVKSIEELEDRHRAAHAMTAARAAQRVLDDLARARRQA